MTTRPFRFQRVGARQIHRWKGRALLADEQGLGKSLQALLWLQRHPEARPAIILCPSSMKYQWQKEALLHLGMASEVLEGTDPLEAEQIQDPSLLILNYDILFGWLDYLLDLEPRAVVLDEAHYLSYTTSRRTRCARELCQKVPHVVALTGTPLTNRPAELWPILNLVRPDLYPSFYSYAARYTNPQKTPWGWKYTGATRLEELHRNLREHLMIRRTKVEVLSDLPPKRKNLILVDIEKRAEYQKALDNFVDWMAEKKPEKLESALRAEGLVKIGYLKRLVGELKLSAAIDWIENFLSESDGKLVVMAIHKKIMQGLAEKFRKVCCVLDGTTPQRERQQVVERFQEEKGPRLFLGNIKAAGVGITLTRASDLIFLELPWTPGDLDQASDRIHRIGQTNPVLIHYLIARNTIEHKLIDILSSKQRIITAVLEGGEESIDFDIYHELCKSLRVATPTGGIQ